ncbi:MAG TPA: M13 family metallopeptidase [Terracidiphilus sp.]|nr:M13 family metallopeptidase [Terracidiphilus sp.]
MKTGFAVLFASACAALAPTRVVAQSTQSPSHAQDQPIVDLHHIDVTQVDSAINPCDNFYQYVCGKLNAENPIPADQVYWGVSGELNSWNLQVLRQILISNEAPSPVRTPNQQKIGDFYASCTAQASSGANDLAAIEPLLRQIHGLRDKRDIAKVLATLHRSFGRAWESGDEQTRVALFGFGPQADYNDVRHVVAGVDQGGLGMPGREFYLNDDDQSKALREKYKTLISSLLAMDGESAAQAAADASTILRLETALARAQMDDVSRRDPNKVNNRFTLEQLKALTPAFDWDAYLRGIGAPPVPLYEVSAPDFFRALSSLLVNEDLATWKLYLRWQLLLSADSFLGNSSRDAQFAFTSALYGIKQQAPAWRRCTEDVDTFLGQALGQVYVEKVFPPSSKERAEKMVKDIEAAMSRDIDSVTWMQPETKRQAQLKLAAVLDKIGYPDKWIDYGSLAVGRSSFPLNVERATAFEFQRQLGFIGKPLDRTQWDMTPPTVDAYEDPQANTINFPAGILQPVYFDPAEDDVINYGAEGAVVGHELTHDFDDQGRKFDVNGNLRDWWTPEDAKAYEQRGECIAKEYTGPVPGVPGVTQNGKLTQGEDTADNGGIYLALSALMLDLSQHGKTLEDKDAHGLTNLQRFFIAYGTSWCDQIRPEAARTLVLTNPHSVPELRVNNVVGNMPEFQKAFDCKAGQPEVHAAQCRVW